jgi:tetratricopeptide (TPR) repeat protein
VRPRVAGAIGGKNPAAGFVTLGCTVALQHDPDERELGNQVFKLRFTVLALILQVWGTAAREPRPGYAEELGEVRFTTSCSEVAQKEFDRAVALLHSFQFSRAIAGFNVVLSNDPTCGVAYWGIALSDWSNPFASGMKDKIQLQMGRQNADRGKALGAKTERERAYIAAVSKLYADFETTPQRDRLLAYRDAMHDVAGEYPDDHEAQIFYALALAASEDLSDKTYASRLQAGAILEKLFVAEPNHPGLAHYIIHTYDVPALADRALIAARRYSAIAPDAPHALHMPSHTFTRTGFWQESIEANIAATAAARREGQTAEELHGTDYEVYAYLQTGQDQAARRIVDSLPEISARFDPKAVVSGAGGPPTGYFALAAIPARYALERQDWKLAAQLPVRETPYPYTEAMTWFARGLGAARLGLAQPALESAAELQQIHDRLARIGESYWARQVEIQQSAVSAWAVLARGKNSDARMRMIAAANMEDETEKSAITPGPLAPARELLGEMLLQLNEPEQALEQFELTLKKEPGRFRALYGAAHAAELSRNRDASKKYYRELLRVAARADDPGRPELGESRRAISRD